MERYESLRRYVVEGRSILATQPLGLALWIAKGMAGWMGEWSKLSQSSPQSLTAVSPAAYLADGAWQQELTMVLAQMTFSNLQPRCSL